MKKKIGKNLISKGQLISIWFYGVVDFLHKTNENKSTWGIIEVKSNLFVRFLEEIDDPKNHFEINWPLVTTINKVKVEENTTLNYFTPQIYVVEVNAI